MGLGWLRFILSMMVLDQHYGGYRYWVLPHLIALVGIEHIAPIGEGAIAVTGFFVLSGYLIAHVLSIRYTAPTEPGGKAIRLWSFYLSRALRIFPLYWLVLALTAVAYAYFGLLPQWNRFAFAGNFWLIGYGIQLLGVNVHTLLPLEVGQSLLLPQAWTITLDLCFYLLAPLVLFSPIWRRTMIITGMLVALAFAWKISYVPQWYINIYQFGWVYWIAFLLGAEARLSWDKVSGWLVGPAIIFLFYAAYLPLYSNPVILQMLSIPAFTLLIHHLHAQKRAPRLDRFLGELTYATYLIQLPVLVVMQRIGIGHYKLVAVFLVYVLSVALTFLFEAPLDRLRYRWTQGLTSSYRITLHPAIARATSMLMFSVLLWYYINHLSTLVIGQETDCTNTQGDCTSRLPYASVTVCHLALPASFPELGLRLYGCGESGNAALAKGRCLPGNSAVIAIFSLPHVTIVGVDSLFVYSFSKPLNSVFTWIHSARVPLWYQQQHMAPTPISWPR